MVDSPEPLFISVFDSHNNVLFQHTSKTFHNDLRCDLVDILSVCSLNAEVSPKLAYNMEMGEYEVAVSSAISLFCMVIVNNKECKLARHLTAIFSIFFFYKIIDDMEERESSVPIFYGIAIPSDPLYKTQSFIEKSLMKNPVEYIEVFDGEFDRIYYAGSLRSDGRDVSDGIYELLDQIEEDDIFLTSSNCPNIIMMPLNKFLHVAMVATTPITEENVSMFTKMLSIATISIPNIFKI